MKTKSKSIRTISLIVSISLFLISLFFDSFCTSDGCMASILAFILGIVGLPIVWFSNPVLILSWILIKKPTVSLILGVCALLLSLSFLFYNEIEDFETGKMKVIIKYGIGYWIWLLSSLPIILGSLGQLIYKNKGL